MTILTLFAYILGTSTPAIPIKIDGSETIGVLKKEIVKEKPKTFQGIEPDLLTLYKVAIPDGRDLEKVALSVIQEKEDLLPSFEISEVFQTEPAKRTICIVVKLPVLNPLKRKRPKMISLSETIYMTEPEPGTPDSKRSFPQNTGLKELIEYPNVIAIDKTKYIELLDEKYERMHVLFLRPRRWGKSTLLDLLANYYDKRNEECFDDLFGGLYIGNHPTEWRTSLLVLRFDFSEVYLSVSLEATEKKFHAYLNYVLKNFLIKNTFFLGGDHLDKLDQADGSVSLKNVLELVADRGYKLFVGVDEYDAPANSLLFQTPGDYDYDYDQLSRLFKSEFFAKIKGESGYNAVVKYWVTGVLPVFREGISPLNHVQSISHLAEFNGLCGLTTSEVDTITSAYLPLSLGDEKILKTKDILKYWFNGYRFSSELPSDVETMFNPRFVFDHLQGVKHPGLYSAPIEEVTAMHISNVFDAVAGKGGQEFIDTFLQASSGNIREQVLISFGRGEVLEMGTRKDVIQSLLYYFGLLTYRENSTTLKPPNATMANVFHRRLQPHLKRIPSLPSEFYANLVNGDGSRLGKYLETILNDHPTRSIVFWNEITLQSVILALFSGTIPCLSELCLLGDPFAPLGKGRLGFVDLIFPNAKSVPCIELKHLALEDVYRGSLEKEKRKHYTGLPSVGPLDLFRKQLKGETEEDLLKREVYDVGLSMGKPYITVADKLESATKQIIKYLDVIAKGNCITESSIGINDRRSRCEQGNADLIGFVLICIGGARVLTWRVDSRQTTFSYGVWDSV